MPTLGEKRIRTTFNPSQDDNVSQIKQKTAELIDLLLAIKYEPSNNYGNSIERERLIDIAMTEYEEAAMWAVKAATTDL